MRAKQFIRKIYEAKGDDAGVVVAEVIKLIGEGHTEVSPDVITTKVSAALGRPFMLKDLVAANNASLELQHYIDSINPTKIKFSTDILTVKNEDPVKAKEKAQSGVASMASRAASRPRLGESDQGISKSAETKFHKKLDTLVHDTFGKRKEEMKESQQELSVGDPVEITGKVEHQGETGEVSDIGQNGAFVVVNLYNHGKVSFHSSDVSYNDYADSDEEEAEMYDRDPDFRKWADTQDVTEGDENTKVFTDENGQPYGEIGIDTEASPGGGNWYVKHYASGYDVVGFDDEEEAAEELAAADEGWRANKLGEGWKSALATGAMGAALAFGGSGTAQAGQSPEQAPQKASAPTTQQAQAQNPYNNDLGILVGVAQSKGGMQVLGKILTPDQIQNVKAAYAKVKADPNVAKSAEFKQGQQLGFQLGNSYADSSSEQTTALNKRGPSYAGILSPMMVKPGEARSAEDIASVNKANAGKLKQAVTGAYGNLMAGGMNEGWESGPDEREPRERDPDAEYDDMRQQKADAPYAKQEPKAKGYMVVSLDTKQPVVDTMFATSGEAMAYIQQNYGKNLAYRAIYEGRDTPLRDLEDYEEKRKALQDIQSNPHTSKDPDLSIEVMRRLAGLERQRSELK